MLFVLAMRAILDCASSMRESLTAIPVTWVLEIDMGFLWEMLIECEEAGDRWVFQIVVSPASGHLCILDTARVVATVDVPRGEDSWRGGCFMIKNRGEKSRIVL